MNVRNVYWLVSTRTKKKALMGELKGYMHSINPENCDYEVEEGILNCYGTMEQAKKIRDRLDKEKQVAIMGGVIPEECILHRCVNRHGHGKQYVADRLQERVGYRNYLAPLFYVGEQGTYLIMTDMTCFLEVFDPEEAKTEPVEAAKPAGEEKKPEQTIKTAVRETLPDVCLQTDKEGGTPAWVFPSAGGALFGFLMGVAASKMAQEHPVMTAAAIPVGAAALGVVWMYKHSN